MEDLRIETRPCKWCREPTRALALLECPKCWEVRTAIEINPERLYIARSYDPVWKSVKAVVKAIEQRGRNPRYHRFLMRRHQEEWPTLWKALRALRSAVDRPLWEEEP